MKESKAVYVTKRDFNAELNREYQLFVNKVVRYEVYSPETARYGQETLEVGCQYDCKRDNLICTCKYLAAPRSKQEIRYFRSPKHIYSYQGSRSFTDIGVGSVKTLQRKKVKRIYLPETNDRGVGNSDLPSYVLQRTKQQNMPIGYYDNKRTLSKCVGRILDYNIGFVINKKLSPIVQTISGSTSYTEFNFNTNIEKGNSAILRSIANTTTQVENLITRDVEIEAEVEQKITKDIEIEVESEEIEQIEQVEQIVQPTIMTPKDPEEMNAIAVDSRKPANLTDKVPERVSSVSLHKPLKTKDKPTEGVSSDSLRKPVKTKYKPTERVSSDSLRQPTKPKQKPTDRVSSSDSLLQHVHNLENRSIERNSRMSLEAEDLMENKLEYRNIFSAKSKESKHSAHNSMLKSTSTLRRRFQALRRGLAKKVDSKKNCVIVKKESSQVSTHSRKDVSINSDPPSLEGRSIFNMKPYTPFTMRYNRDRSMHNLRASHYRRPVTDNKERGRAEWSSKGGDDDSETHGVKGMFKLWGKKFNLEEGNYNNRQCTPKPSYNPTRKEEIQKIEIVPMIQEPPPPSKLDPVPEPEPGPDEKKEGRRFFFFKNKKKSKEKEIEKEKKSFKTKKGVTAGLCEVRDGLVIKILGDIIYKPEDIRKEPEICHNHTPDDYEEMFRKSWLKKFLTPTIDSLNSVKVRWNNKTYAPSSSTVFELVDNIYKDSSLDFSSKSQVTVQSSYRSHTRQHVNYMQQNMEAWMIPKTFTNRPMLLPVKQIQKQLTCQSDEDTKDKIEIRISDQKWFIDKSKAFSHKIEVVLHSKNFKKLYKEESSEYLRIDIPKGFFMNYSNDEVTKLRANQSSDEEVFKIVEYETGSELKKDKGTRNISVGEHKQNKIKVTVSVKEGTKCVSKVLETPSKPTSRDVVVQGSHVFIPRRYDGVGVGIITHRDLSQIRKPILKIQDDFSVEESEHNLLMPNTKKYEFAESYLQDYYRDWTRLGIDLFSWCASDSQLKCCSEHSRSSFQNQGDVTRSCSNIFEDFHTATIVSSCGASSFSQTLQYKPQNISDFPEKRDKKKKKAKEKEPNPEKRTLPKDSIEVFKKRKVYAASNKSKWLSYKDTDCARPPRAPSVESKCSEESLMKSCCKPKEQPNTNKCPYKKHVSLPDCDTMNNVTAKQLASSVPESILVFKGTNSCDVCKRKEFCSKHATVIPQPSCEIPRAPCRGSCQHMKKPPCASSKQSCEKLPQDYETMNNGIAKQLASSVPERTLAFKETNGCDVCKRKVFCSKQAAVIPQPSCEIPRAPCRGPCEHMKKPPCASSKQSCEKLPQDCDTMDTGIAKQLASSVPERTLAFKETNGCDVCKRKVFCSKQAAVIPQPSCEIPRAPCRGSCEHMEKPPCALSKQSCEKLPQDCDTMKNVIAKQLASSVPESTLALKETNGCECDVCKKKEFCSKPATVIPQPSCEIPRAPCRGPCEHMNKPPCASSKQSCEKLPQDCDTMNNVIAKQLASSVPESILALKETNGCDVCKRKEFCSKHATVIPQPSYEITRAPCRGSCEPMKKPPCASSKQSCDKQPCEKLPQDCDTMNNGIAKQLASSAPERTLAFKGTNGCDVCKRKEFCSKHATVIPQPSCEIPRAPGRGSCEHMKKPPCASSIQSCEKLPPCARQCPMPPKPCPQKQPAKNTRPCSPVSPQNPSTPTSCNKPPHVNIVATCPPPSCPHTPPCQPKPSPPPEMAPPCPPKPSPPPCPPKPSPPPQMPLCPQCSCAPTYPQIPYPPHCPPPPCHSTPSPLPTYPHTPPCYSTPSPLPTYPHTPPPCKRPPNPRPCASPTVACKSNLRWPTLPTPPKPCTCTPHSPPLSIPASPRTPPSLRKETCLPSPPPSSPQKPTCPCGSRPPRKPPMNKKQFPPSPPCGIKKTKNCPMVPPSCRTAPPQCCTDPDRCPSSPPPCQKSLSKLYKLCKKKQKSNTTCPGSPPCKPMSCQSSLCRSLACPQSLTSVSYRVLRPDIPFYYSPIHPCTPEIVPEPKVKKSVTCHASLCHLDDEFPWPTKNQVSNQPSNTSLCQNSQESYGKCMKDSPMFPKMSSKTVKTVSSVKKCKPSYPNFEGSPRLPCLSKISGMQCPPPRHPCPSPPAEPLPVPCPPPIPSKSKPKVSGIFLKMMPAPKKTTCSKDCLTWENGQRDGSISFNSKEKITIRLKKQTASTGEIREGLNIQVQDEDGMTLFERKDYSLQHTDCSIQRQPSLLGELYKASEVHRVITNNSTQDKGTHKETRKEIEEVVSDTSVANLIEIQFKLKVTQGEKTTEINIANDGDKDLENIERKVPIKISTPEVYVVKNENERSAEQSDQKNDINIRIVIKNFKSKSGTKKSVNVNQDDYYDFTKKISAKFHTVSTGYSDVFHDDHVFSVHRATVDLTSSVENTRTDATSMHCYKTDYSIKSVHDNKSVHSKKSVHSNRSVHSNTSVLTKHSVHSNKSNKSTHSYKIILTKQSFHTKRSVHSNKRVPTKQSVHTDKSIHTYKSVSINKSAPVKRRIHSNRSVEIINEPGSSEDSVCRCITTEDEKSEDTDAESFQSLNYSNTKEIQENAEETDTQVTDHKYEYNEDTDTEKPIKYDTEETDTDRQIDHPKYDTETDTERKQDKKYDTFMSTSDTDEPDMLPEIRKSHSLDVIVKPQTKEQKKEILKHVMEKVHDTKIKNKTRMRILRDMLKVKLTSDSSGNDDTNNLAKDVTYASLKPNYFRDTDSMQNYYKLESKAVLSDAEINGQVVYPSVENNSACSNSVCSVDVVSSDNVISSKRGGCMCSTVAARLKLASRIGEVRGCCCANKKTNKKDEETICDLKSESDTQIDYKTTEFEDVHTQNSRYLTSKLNGTNLSAHSSINASKGGSFYFEGLRVGSEVLNVDTRQFGLKNTISPGRVHLRECEMRKPNRNATLHISDDEKIVLRSGHSTRLPPGNIKARDEKQEPKTRAADILQSYEAKKAVLEIYTEKTISDDGEHLVAKLPKFVHDREQEIHANYVAMAKNIYKTVCKKKILLWLSRDNDF